MTYMVWQIAFVVAIGWAITVVIASTRDKEK